jgi:hypothetical protein
VIQKFDSQTFVYAWQHRKKGDELFFNTITGVFKATKTLRKGSGAIAIHVGEVSGKLKLDKWAEPLEKIEIGYANETFPVTVIMKFTHKPGQAVQSYDYGYQAFEDQSGGMGAHVKGPDTNISQIDLGSAWIASGAGYGVLSVVEGAFKGATQIDCWDAAFNIVYATQTWPGGKTVGDPKSCVTVEKLPMP